MFDLELRYYVNLKLLLSSDYISIPGFAFVNILTAMIDEGINESLVFRRPKRSTAGNRYAIYCLYAVTCLSKGRMEAALAELGLEDLTKEAEDDRDFFVEKGKYVKNL